MGLDGIELRLKITMAYLSLHNKPAVIAIAREAVDNNQVSSFLEMNEQLRRQINTDSLTEIPNRRYFEEILALEWTRCIAQRCSISLI